MLPTNYGCLNSPTTPCLHSYLHLSTYMPNFVTFFLTYLFTLFPQSVVSLSPSFITFFSNWQPPCKPAYKHPSSNYYKREKKLAVYDAPCHLFRVPSTFRRIFPDPSKVIDFVLKFPCSMAFPTTSAAFQINPLQTVSNAPTTLA